MNSGFSSRAETGGWHTLVCTGHRPDNIEPNGYSEPARIRLWQFACVVLSELNPKLVISGGALGFDQAIAAAAATLDIQFDIYIPFVGQEKMWPEESQVRYRKMLAHAREIVVVCDGGYAAWKMQRRNERMSDQLTKPEDVLLALWNGSSGGTANCLKYAKSKQKNILNVWDRWEKWE